MEQWQILGVSIGAALITARLWRKPRATQTGPNGLVGGDVKPTEPIADHTEVWIELDVEPLFPSSEPVLREYLLDVTELGEPESDRQP